MIPRRIALLSLFALSLLQVAAQEPPVAVGGPEASGPALTSQPAAVVISAQKAPAVSFGVRRYLPRRKERAAWRPVRREWGVPARCDVTENGELLRRAELAAGSRFSLLFDTLGRIGDDERGPPAS